MSASNPQQFAKNFMDLWQKQIATVASDKQFIQAMLEMMQSFSMSAHDTKTNTNAANPADAPDVQPRMLAELAFRLSACERRLDDLEKGSRKGSKKPRK